MKIQFKLNLFNVKNILLLLIFSVVITGCGGSGGDSDSTTADGFTRITGQVQKGLFTELSITAFPLNGSTTEAIQATILDEGRYEILVPEGSPLRLVAEGSFIDEITGLEVELAEPLEVVLIEPEETPRANINLLTHLVAKQTLSRAAGGVPLATAFEQAQNFVRETLGYPDTVEVVDLDMFNIQSDSDLDDPNLQLLLFSAAVLNEFPTQEGQSFGDDFFGIFVPEFSELDDGALAIAQLSPLLGLNAGALYGQIIDAGVLDVPALDQPIGDGAFECDNDMNCGFVYAETPSLFISMNMVYESQGTAYARLRFTPATNSELTVQLKTQQNTAREFIDYVPLSANITIPVGSTEVSVPLTILIDTEAEPTEYFSVEIVGEVTDYFISRRQSSLRLIDGYKEQVSSAGLFSSSIEIVNSCLNDIDLPSQPKQASCANSNINNFKTFHDGVVASADVSLSLSENCDEDECSSAVYASDWLVKFSLRGENDTNSVDLGVHQYSTNSLRNNSAQRFQFNVSDALKSQIRDAQSTGSQLRLHAELLLDAEQAIDKLVDEIILLPAVLQAGGISTQLAAAEWQLQPLGSSNNQNCAADEYALSGNFSVGGSIVHQADVCVNFNADGSMNLQYGEIELAGDEIPLPPFHGMFLRFDDDRLVPRGGSRLLVPTTQPEILPLPIPLSIFTGSFATYPGLRLVESENEPTSVDIFIHREGFPSAFKVESAQLTPAGVRINYDAVQYLHAGFDALDTRADSSTLASNDNWYQGLQNTGSLMLTGTGLTGVLAVAETQSYFAFPRVNVRVEATQISMASGLASTKISVAGDVSMGQSIGCTDNPTCVAERNQGFLADGNLIIDATGAQLSTLSMVSATRPAWGRLLENTNAFALPDQLSTNAAVHVALPGFLFSAIDDPISTQLLAHYQESPNVIFHIPHKANSEAAILGNYWPVGFSVGPELYVNSSGNISNGSGESLANNEFVINSPNATGSDEQRLNLRSGKYVLRPSGVTGVMNVNDNSLLTPKTFSGFNIQFDRFALRFRDNQIGDFSYVDGALNVPGHADLDLTFESLSFFCDGSLGAANLTSTDCVANPTGENCGHRLLSWKAPVDIYNMAFESAVAESCEIGDQNLGLEHLLSMASLNKPLDVKTSWNSDGDLQDSFLHPVGDYRLEVPGNDRRNGFAIHPTAATLDVQVIGAQNYGTVALDIDRIRLPFWNALSAEARLANSTLTLAEPTVLVPIGKLAGLNQLQRNQAMQNGVLEDSALDFTASYDWGSSGFGINLPMYFSPAAFNDDIGNKPQFVGRYLEHDVVIMQAGAGVNHVNAKNTKLSFGVSANIQQVASTPFQFSLTAGTSLDDIDGYLVSVGILDAPVFSQAFGRLQSLYNGLSEFSGAGVERLMAESLRELNAELLPAQGSVSPFAEYADSYSLAANFSTHIELRLQETIQAPVLNLRTGFVQLTPHVESIELQLQQDLNREGAEQVLDDMRAIKNQIEAYRLDMLQTQENIQASLFLSDSHLTQAKLAVSTVQNSLSGIATHLLSLSTVDASLCAVDAQIDFANVSSVQGGYLTGLFKQFGRMQEISQTLGNSADLVNAISVIAAGDASIERSLQRFTQLANTQASVLENMVNRTSDTVLGVACAEQNDRTSNLMAEALVFLNQQAEQLQLLQAGLDAFDINSIKNDLLNGPGNEITSLINNLQAIETAIGFAENSLIAGVFSTPANINIVITANQGELILQRLSSNLNSISNGYIGGFSDQYTEDAESPIFLEVLTTQTLAIDQGYQVVVNNSLDELKIDLPGAQLSGEQFETLLINKILQGAAISNLSNLVSLELTDLNVGLTDLNLLLSDTINRAIAKALGPLNAALNELFAEATSVINQLPIAAGEIDGYAIVNDTALERVHVGSKFTLPGTDGQDPTKFVASIDVYAGSAALEATGCAAVEGVEPLQANINVMSSPINVMGSEISINRLFLGFSLDGSSGAILPLGVQGELFLGGEIDYEAFQLMDMGLVAAVGTQQNYFGATAAAVFSNQRIEAAFFAGVACKAETLLNLDADAKRFIDIEPDDRFAGIYVRGAGPFPLVAGGCGLNLTINAKMGLWYINSNFGGTFGGGATGQVACIGSLRGEMTLALQQSRNGGYRYDGSGFGVAGLGSCEPHEWTSARRSRGDGYCGTADVTFDAFYEDGDSDLYNLKFSAVK